MSIWSDFLCKVFGIRCPEPPKEELCSVCQDTGKKPNDTCSLIVATCKSAEFCPTEVCEVEHPPREAYICDDSKKLKAEYCPLYSMGYTDLPTEVCNIPEHQKPPRKVTRTVCVDSELIRRKHCVTKETKKFEPGTQPTTKCDIVEHWYKRTVTPYRLFENAKVMAAVNPGDLHSNVWKFHENFTAANYVQTDESLAKNSVNSKRYFGHTGEGEYDLDPELGFLVPFQRLGRRKFNLWELDPQDFWGEYGIFWRYARDVERAMIPIICGASGWKGFRYRYTAWHPFNNVGVKVTSPQGVTKTIYMTSDHQKLITDPDSARIYRGVMEMYVEALRDLEQYHPTGVKDPFILESVNEYAVKNCGDKKFFEWHHALFSMLEKKKKLDPTRMAFEKWNSRWIGVKKLDPDNPKLLPGLMDIFPGIWCFYHGQTTFEQAIRWHKGEMGKIHNAYPGLCADSDGHESQYKARGIIGKGWGGGGKNINFRRMSPVDLQKFLVYDSKHNGAGICRLGASILYEDSAGRYDSHVKAFDKGFTKAQLSEYQRMVEDYRGITFEVEWGDFSYEVRSEDGKILNRKPLSEGKAIKRAMNQIHK